MEKNAAFEREVARQKEKFQEQERYYEDKLSSYVKEGVSFSQEKDSLEGQLHHQKENNSKLKIEIRELKNQLEKGENEAKNLSTEARAKESKI